VTVESGGKQKRYQILGSSETDPTRGIISHKSPIGAALIGKKIGAEAKVEVNSRTLYYKIIKIE
jgi:transcription elongation GreA/GreB family factor